MKKWLIALLSWWCAYAPVYAQSAGPWPNVVVQPNVYDFGNGPLSLRVIKGNSSIFTSQGSGVGSTAGSSTSLTLTAIPTTPPCVGCAISGTGILAGTTVAARVATSLTLSAAANVPNGTALAWGAACPSTFTSPYYIQGTAGANYWPLYTTARICATSPGGAGDFAVTQPILYDQVSQSIGFVTTPLLFLPDNTIDIGALNSSRPRTLYAGTSVYAQSDTGIIGLGAALDVLLQRDAAGQLGQRNGANRQILNVYRTYTDPSNYERVRIGTDGTNTTLVVTDQAGTGSARSLTVGTQGSAALNLRTGGTNRWTLDTSGNLTAVADATYNIGAPGASRPVNVYVSSSLTVPGLIMPGSVSGSLAQTVASAAGAGSFIVWPANMALNLTLTGGTGTVPAQDTLGGPLVMRRLFCADIQDAGTACPANAVAPATPTTLIGLTATRGVLTTYMPSDAAPTINQAAAWAFSALGNTTLAIGSVLRLPAGANGSPSLNWGTASVGMYAATSLTINFTSSSLNIAAITPNGVRVRRGGSFGISTDPGNVAGDTFWSAPSAGFWQSGEPDVATGAIPQSMGVQNNTGAQDGPDWTFFGANSGAGNHGGQIVLKTADAGAYSTALTLTRTRQVIVQGAVGAPGLTTATGGLAAGIFSAASNVINISANGANHFGVTTGGIRLLRGDTLAWSSSNPGVTGADTFMSNPAAAQNQFGSTDAASPVAQTVSFQSVAAGNGNTAGANATIRGSLSNGTGGSTGGGGDLIFQTTASVAGSGVQNSGVEVIRLTSGTNNIKFRTSSTGASTQTFTNSPCTGLTTERWIPVEITLQTGTWFIPACQ